MVAASAPTSSVSEAVTNNTATVTAVIVTSFTKTLDACKDDACTVAAANTAVTQAAGSGAPVAAIATDIINVVTESGADQTVIKEVTTVVTTAVSPN